MHNADEFNRLDIGVVFLPLLLGQITLGAFVGKLLDTTLHVDISPHFHEASHDKKNCLGALHVVSAWASEASLSLGQLATEEKSNEITAIPELLEQIDVKDAIVTIDAMGCQKQIARKIQDEGGDYVLALKGNHEKLHEAVAEHFDQLHENDFQNSDCRRRQTKEKGHGRVEQRFYYQAPLPEALQSFTEQWKGLTTIGQEHQIPDSHHFGAADLAICIADVVLTKILTRCKLKSSACRARHETLFDSLDVATGVSRRGGLVIGGRWFVVGGW